MTMKINPEVIAKIMFQARTKACEISQVDAICLTGEDHSQYMDIATLVADFIDQYDVEAQAIARYILDKVNLSSIEAISHRWPPSRILP